jgi:hypothetical protein
MLLILATILLTAIQSHSTFSATIIRYLTRMEKTNIKLTKLWCVQHNKECFKVVNIRLRKSMMRRYHTITAKDMKSGCRDNWLNVQSRFICKVQAFH